MQPSRSYEAYFFDVDGTLCLGAEAIEGATQALQQLRERKAIVRFLSNDSTSDREGHVRRLRRAGIECTSDEVLTTIEATVSWLVRHYPRATVYPIGAPDLTAALTSHGIAISDDPAAIDIVIASCDHHLSFPKLQVAFDALRTQRRAFLIATNPDQQGPLPGGHARPDTAAVIAALEACTGATCQIVIGKPNPHMLTAALADLRVAPQDALMVGDTLATDIAVAHAGGTDSALTLTGDTSREQLIGLGPGARPTWVVENLLGLLPR